MLMILARLVRSESFWAVVKVRSPHTGPGISYIITSRFFWTSCNTYDIPLLAPWLWRPACPRHHLTNTPRGSGTGC